MAATKLTKAAKSYIMQNTDLTAEQLAEDIGVKVNKELKDFLETSKATKASLPEPTSIKPPNINYTVLNPTSPAEDSAFNKAPPLADCIVRHTPKV